MTVPEDDRSGSPASLIPATETHVEALERLPPGTLLSERYRIVETAGVGGMGVVYLARDEKLGIDIAVKVLRADLAADPRVLERFRGELLSAREVTHKHVVRTHDIGEHGSLRFLTMTYVPGHSLRETLEQDGPLPLPLPRALAIARQIAEALAAAHEKGIVHRDLKPGNVLVDPRGNAYVTDFGIVRSLGHEGLTRAGAIVGTPDYLAPKRRQRAALGRSDTHTSDCVRGSGARGGPSVRRRERAPRLRRRGPSTSSRSPGSTGTSRALA